MNKKIKILSILLSMLMLISTFSAYSYVFAASGDSESNPYVCDTFSKFKAAMESSTIKYVKLLNTSETETIPNPSEERAAIIVTSPKVLTVEGKAVFTSPEKGNVNALIEMRADVTVNGGGSLQYNSGSNKGTASMFYLSSDVLLTIEGNVNFNSVCTTLKKSWNVGRVIYAYTGRVYVKGGTFNGTEQLYNSDILGKVGVIHLGGTVKAIVQGGTFNSCFGEDYDYLLPAFYIDANHKDPGYIHIMGGTFNGIVSKAKTFENYIYSNCVALNETTNELFSHEGQTKTPSSADAEGVANWDVISIEQVIMPQFDYVYSEILDRTELFQPDDIEAYVGETQTFRFNNVPAVESMTSKGLYFQKEYIFYEGDTIVARDATSNTGGLYYEYKYNKTGHYAFVMIIKLCYNGKAIKQMSTSIGIDVVKKPVEINSVALSVNEPVVNSNGENAITNTDGVTVISTVWQQFINGQYIPMDASSAFKNGSLYRVAITVSANDGFELASDMTATVSGENAVVGTNNAKTAVLYRSYVAAEGNYVNIQINQPLVTQTVADNNIAGSIKTTSNYPSLKVVSAKWFDADGVEFNGKFMPNGKYTTRIAIKCAIGSFAPDTIFKINGNEVSSVTYHEIDGVAMVEYTFWLGSSYISINDVEIPLEYEKASTPKYNVTVSDNNENIEITASWLDANGNEFKGSFQPGEKYVVKFDVMGINGGKISNYTFIINGKNPTSNETISSAEKAIYFEIVMPTDVVCFTKDSIPQDGKTMTVDLEKMAEFSDAVADAYLNGNISIKWFVDGKNVSSRASGDLGEKLTLTKEDVTKTIYAVVVADVETITSRDFVVSEKPFDDESEEAYKLGDINNNGTIDSMDYVYLRRAYFGTYTLKNIAVGDINKNGNIDSMDYVYLRRAYFGTYVIK